MGACLPAGCSSEENRELVQREGARSFYTSSQAAECSSEVVKHPVKIRCESRELWSIGSVIFAYSSEFALVAAILRAFQHRRGRVDERAAARHFSPLVARVDTTAAACARARRCVLASGNQLQIYIFNSNARNLQRNVVETMRTKRLETYDFRAAPGITVLSIIVLASSYVYYLMIPYLGHVCNKNIHIIQCLLSASFSLWIASSYGNIVNIKNKIGAFTRLNTQTFNFRPQTRPLNTHHHRFRRRSR